LEDVHAAMPVKSWVVLSLNEPVAKKVIVVLVAIELLAGVTAIDCSVAEVTVSVVEVWNWPLFTEAEMVVTPGWCDTAVLPFMVATALSEEDHVAFVNTWVLPSS